MNDLLELTVGGNSRASGNKGVAGGNETGMRGREEKKREGEARGFGSLCPCCHRIAIPPCRGSAPDQGNFVTRYRFDSLQATGHGAAADRLEANPGPPQTPATP